MSLTLLILIFLNFIVAAPLSSEPWGKDADLTWKPISKCSSDSCLTPILGSLAEKAIEFHQEIISPADGPRSHYFPSSSQYTLEAIRRYGFFRGFTMGCDRLMRENDDPWIYPITYDPAGNILKYNPVK